MPKWMEYKRIAKERGALALELYVVNSVPAGPDVDLPGTLPDHLAYQTKLEAEGKLAFAGPVSDATGENMTGEGLIIYRAASLEDARALAEQDPMHQHGVRTFTIRRWLINEGSFTLSVGLSTGKAELS
ncbi:YciI family protein [Roseibium sediminicola]|uniref:YciI family protein n=1 Tax=Roseibium sediminicola TaxID=2933272 RepID=A0ABT0GZ19_9HYPH|nr:YciI family protein [Roseibium sp. CAU 1639]MCK7614669.1 YciI family protein [Roseibium sp. CAU 1639]